MIQYRGYVAKVEYDDSVGLLHASVINSGAYPIANCEAADVQTLKKELTVSIDEYLASCEEDGVVRGRRRRAEQAVLRQAPPAARHGSSPTGRRLRFPKRNEHKQLDQAGPGEKHALTSRRQPA